MPNISLKEKYNKTYNTALLEKWGSHINGVRKVYPEFSDVSAINLATLCENTEEQISKYQRAVSLGEATQSADVGPYIRHAFEIIAGLMPNLVCEEVVTVQALNQKIGQIFFLKYVYGSTKGTVTAGDTAIGPYEVASNPNYSSEHIDQEIFGASGTTTYTGTLNWGPVRAGTVKITAGSITGADDGEGHITGTGITTGTIDYASGAVSLTFAANTTGDVEVEYEYNLENAPAEAADFEMKVSERVVIARPRKLRARYAFDAAYDVEKQWGINMDDQLLEASIGEIKHEIDQEILGDLKRQAGLSNSWNIVKPNAISLEEHYKSFLTKLVEMGNQIYGATKRATGNVVICGLNAATVCESLPGFVPSDASDKVGAYVAGTIKGQIKVIKNPFYGNDDFLVAYKGNNFLDAGFVYAPYLPVFATNVVMLDDFVGRRGYATSYAKAMLNANYYVKGTITHIADVTSVSAKITNATDDPVNTKEVA